MMGNEGQKTRNAGSLEPPEAVGVGAALSQEAGALHRAQRGRCADVSTPCPAPPPSRPLGSSAFLEAQSTHLLM